MRKTTAIAFNFGKFLYIFWDNDELKEAAKLLLILAHVTFLTFFDAEGENNNFRGGRPSFTTFTSVIEIKLKIFL